MKEPSKTPQEMKKEMLESLNQPMVKTLNEYGITDRYLTRKLKKELCAKEVKVFNDKGKIISSGDLIAWEIRQRARQDAHKLRGDYPLERLDLTGSMKIDRSPEEQEFIRKVAQEVAQKIREGIENK